MSEEQRNILVNNNNSKTPIARTKKKLSNKHHKSLLKCTAYVYSLNLICIYLIILTLQNCSLMNCMTCKSSIRNFLAFYRDYMLFKYIESYFSCIYCVVNNEKKE